MLDLTCKNAILTKDRISISKYFREYFDKNYRNTVTGEVLCVPAPDYPGLESHRKTILKTLGNWCNNTNQKRNFKGFVIDNYNLNAHLNFLKYPTNFFEKNDVDLSNTTIVYNPVKRAVLIIRTAEDGNLKREMELSTMDLIKLVLLYKNVLAKSNVTVINLLLTKERLVEYPWACKNCQFQIILAEYLESSESLENWWVQNEEKLIKCSRCHEKFDKDFDFNFLAELIGFLASFQFEREGLYGDGLPSLTDDPAQQLSEMVLMTSEQRNIAYSADKHILIEGCYGSGKTIVANKKAEIIFESLGREDSLYYIICDSRSMLNVKIKSNYPQMNVDRHEEQNQKSQSSMIEEILQKDSKKGKLNLIFDEFDGESLIKREAEKLNKLFKTNERIKDSNVILIPQPIKITRKFNNDERKKNMFDMLETFKKKELTFNMRTTVEINNLVTATVNALHSHKPVHYSSEKEKIINATVALEKPVDQSSQEKRETSTSVSSEKTVHQKSRKITEKNTKETFPLEYKHFKLDEVCDLQKSATEESSATKITSTFHHMHSKECGRNITSEIPNLFEIDHPEDGLQLIIKLMVILQKLMEKQSIPRENNHLCISQMKDLTNMADMEQHVILHFDTKNCIPEIFWMVFKLMNFSDKEITTNYGEFKINKSKKIFICDYRKFRGLEYPRVIVVLDPSLDHLLHYLPECFNRCTTFLNIIIVQMLNVDERQSPNRSFRHIIESWKQPLNHQQLVKEWKIDAVDVARDYSEIVISSNSEKILMKIEPDVSTALEVKIKEFKDDFQKMTENDSQKKYDLMQIERDKKR